MQTREINLEIDRVFGKSLFVAVSVELANLCAVIDKNNEGAESFGAHTELHLHIHNVHWTPVLTMYFPAALLNCVTSGIERG